MVGVILEGSLLLVQVATVLVGVAVDLATESRQTSVEGAAVSETGTPAVDSAEVIPIDTETEEVAHTVIVEVEEVTEATTSRTQGLISHHPAPAIMILRRFLFLLSPPLLKKSKLLRI